ncbi:MAG: acyltransferase family protein [Thermoguttaceae bacterium]
MGLLRLLLAVSVVLVHTRGCFGFRPLGAAEAVQAFYMISGFYMAMILTEKYRGPGSYRLFLSNRFLRIYPIYWITVVLSIFAWATCYLLTGQAGPLAARVSVGLPGCAVLGVCNALIFGQDAVLFTALDAHGGLVWTSNCWSSSPPVSEFLLVPQAWSLGVELLFYLCAPFLVRRSPRILIGVILTSLALRGYVYFHLGWTHDPWTYRFFPLEIAFFLAGSLGYQLYRRIRTRCVPPRWLLPGLALFFLICLLYQFVPAWDAGGVVIKQWIFYVLAWVAIPWLFTASKDSRIDRYLGELSYPLYLVHFLAVWFLPPLLLRIGIAQAVPLWVLAASLGLSVGLIHFVSAPLERIRQQRVAKPAAASPLASPHEDLVGVA